MLTTHYTLKDIQSIIFTHIYLYRASLTSKECGGHLNYNANMSSGTKRSVTIQVAKMPFRLQEAVMDCVSDF